MRERLNRDRVVRAAVELADRDGFDGLTMRKLADRLHVVPMAIYKHVADKDELLDAMIDLVFGEAEVPAGAGWRKAMRARATSMREALRRHPWAVGRMETGTPGPENLRHHNAVMECLRREAGFPFRTAVHAYSLLDSYIYGFALQERTITGDVPAELERRSEAVADTSPYPYLMEIAAEFARTGYDYAQEFEFGLDLILDGLDELLGKS
jgi:AcrR family transcriptional regulator